MPTLPPPSRDVALETHVFWIRFRKEVAAVVIIILLAIIGFAGFRFYSDHRDAAASALLASAKSGQDYQQVIARYPDTAGGADAYLLLADVQRAEKKFTDANATLQVFLNKNPDHQLVTTARMAMAANLESMGKIDEALAMYQQIATGYPKSFNAPLALISRMHLLKAKNRNDEARQACETILTQYRDSVWAREAAQELRSLKPAAALPPQAISPGVSRANPAAPTLLARPQVPRPSVAPTANPK